jgi:hypothetical protein
MMLAPQARAQLDSSCTTTPNPVKTDPNPITTCTFDTNRQGVTWLQQQSPVPPNAQAVVAGNVIGAPSNTVCWVTDTPNPNKWAQQWEYTCAPDVVNGQLTAQDTFAGFPRWHHRAQVGQGTQVFRGRVAASRARYFETRA